MTKDAPRQWQPGCSVVKISETKKMVFDVWTSPKGEKMASIREFYKDGETWKPGRNGITVRPELLPAFAKSMRKLYESFEL